MPWHIRSLWRLIILLLVSGCLPSRMETALSHPAVSLAESDSSHILVYPTWSPDGNSLALTGVTKCPIGDCSEATYILDVPTGLVRAFRDGWTSRLAWTADPEVVSFVDYDHTPKGINMTNVTGDSSIEFVVEGDFPAWSSDGSYLAFRRESHQSNDFKPGIFVLELETNHATEVFETLGKDISRISWSPDSNWLAISATWMLSNGNRDSGVFIIKRDGTHVQRIDGGVRIDSGIWGPGWMPDGKWLYFTKDGKLGFAPLDFSCVVIPLDLDGLSYPALSPSGEQIAFEHEGNIYFLDLDEVLGEERGALECP
jgi:Tol biopolymer transport system component